MRSSLIQPYDPNWKNDYNKIKHLLNEALKHLDVSIEHIGSTSVPNLAAKDIIDIDISYSDNVSFDEIEKRLMTLGYFHHGNQGVLGREVFKRALYSQKHSILDAITHHLYVCHFQSKELKRHILMRDYLIRNSSAREEYQTLKCKIASEANQDKKTYAALKEIQASGFIEAVLTQATEEENGIELIT